MSNYRSKNGKIIQLAANERFLAPFYRFVTFICRLFLTFSHEILYFHQIKHKVPQICIVPI